MANSAWISPFGGFTFNGATLAVSGSLNLPSTGVYGWSSTADPNAAADTGISRVSVATIGFGNGSPGSINAALQFASATLGAAGGITWTGRSAIGAPAGSQFQLAPAAFTTGVRLDVGTDGTLKVLNFAGTAATGVIDAGSGFSNNGTAGVATFGPAAVISITVKGGIITAIS